uniref:Glycine-rich cell wall structural protein-like n=1 Tax=Crassostrea virginica TaxID=6565 RepID=A0A8B8EYL9_CRAVI|nr:glycine-rich cell wall structural protein-like [Crassostrea virginica]
MIGAFFLVCFCVSVYCDEYQQGSDGNLHEGIDGSQIGGGLIAGGLGGDLGAGLGGGLGAGLGGGLGAGLGGGLGAGLGSGLGGGIRSGLGGALGGIISRGGSQWSHEQKWSSSWKSEGHSKFEGQGQGGPIGLGHGKKGCGPYGCGHYGRK